MLHQVDAHGLRCDLILPDGLERPPVGGIDEQHDDGDADAGYDKGEQDAVIAGEFPQDVGGIGQRPQLFPLDNGTEDLGKAEGGNGQVVALQAQHRRPDEGSKDRRHQSSQNQRRDLRHLELHNPAVKILVHINTLVYRNGKDGIGIGAQQHKARLPQTEQPGKAV